MAVAATCSIDGCKRAVTCLCLHCNNKVCSRHFHEHQTQINNELLPLTDRLNQLKMKLHMKENLNGPLAMLTAWRDQKYKQIDREYDQKIQELNRKISKQEREVSQIIAKIEELNNEGEASLDQVKQLKQKIDLIENQVNQLMTIEEMEISFENQIDKLNFANHYVQFGGRKYLVKEKIVCRNKNLYALECEVPFTGYDGLCPECGNVHVFLQQNRGFYALCNSVHQAIEQQHYITGRIPARMHSTTFFRDGLKTSPFVSLMSKHTFDEPKSPPSPLSPGQQKRVRFLVDNNNDLSIDDHQSSILFRQGGIGGRSGNISGLDEMENNRRIASNLLFGNTSSSYDFGLMAQTSGIDQPMDNSTVSNDTFTFIQATQRTNVANESGNDGTWLTVFGFRTNADARTLIDEFSRFGVIEKYVIVDVSNIFHVKFETRLQAQRALRKHGHVFGQIMIGVRYCTDKDVIGLKPQSNVNVYLENPFLIRHRHRPGILPSAPLTVQN